VAAAIEQAVNVCITAGECTADIGGSLTTAEAGNAVCARLTGLAKDGSANG
jgi:isocitrate/isopropylmalate dehydrogenase